MKNFLNYLFEGASTKPTLGAILQSVSEQMNGIRPKSLRERRMLSVMKHQLKEARLIERRMSEQIKTLEEQVRLLEEGG